MVSVSVERPSLADGHESARQSWRVDGRRAPKGLTTSLIDIDVEMTDIVFQRQGNRLDGFGARYAPSVVDYAIEGVMRSGPPAAGDDEVSDSFLVYLSGYEDNDRLDRGEDFDQRSVCYIATDQRPDHAWRSNIYVSRFLFRRLVELYVSKRIDCVRISILLQVLRDPSGAIDVPVLGYPSDRHRQHSRAHLMSVQTSLAGAVQVCGAVHGPSTAWSARMGRRQESRLPS
jgi:hypothetical protein